jgi:hypothetical protein
MEKSTGYRAAIRRLVGQRVRVVIATNLSNYGRPNSGDGSSICINVNHYSDTHRNVYYIKSDGTMASRDTSSPNFRPPSSITVAFSGDRTRQVASSASRSRSTHSSLLFSADATREQRSDHHNHCLEFDHGREKLPKTFLPSLFPRLLLFSRLLPPLPIFFGYTLGRGELKDGAGITPKGGAPRQCGLKLGLSFLGIVSRE